MLIILENEHSSLLFKRRDVRTSKHALLDENQTLVLSHVSQTPHPQQMFYEIFKMM